MYFTFMLSFSRFRPLSSSSGFASLDDNAIRSAMPQNLLNIDDIYKNYGEALKHYSKVNFFETLDTNSFSLRFVLC